MVVEYCDVPLRPVSSRNGLCGRPSVGERGPRGRLEKLPADPRLTADLVKELDGVCVCELADGRPSLSSALSVPRWLICPASGAYISDAVIFPLNVVNTSCGGCRSPSSGIDTVVACPTPACRSAASSTGRKLPAKKKSGLVSGLSTLLGASGSIVSGVGVLLDVAVAVLATDSIDGDMKDDPAGPVCAVTNDPAMVELFVAIDAAVDGRSGSVVLLSLPMKPCDRIRVGPDMETAGAGCDPFRLCGLNRENSPPDGAIPAVVTPLRSDQQRLNQSINSGDEKSRQIVRF